MPSPNISIQVEPFESGKVVFLPMAPGSATAKARGRLFLRLDITNKSTKTIIAQSMSVSFPGSSVFEGKSINKSIEAGKTLRWWIQQPQEDILFDLPGPSSINLAFQCHGSFAPFDKTADFTFPLAPHLSPVAGGAYLFPASRVDLALGEYWGINGCNHGIGWEGSQSFGYDMGVWGPNHDDGTYSLFYPKKVGTNNADHRVWGKQVHAMAKGVVLEAVNDCPNNPAPLPLNGDKEHDDALVQEQKTKYWGAYEDAHGGPKKVHGGAGNHFYIQHGDEVVLYAHMQKGLLNKKLLTKEAAVKEGDFLGLAGNSGNASAPHLHIHAIQGTSPEVGPLRPFILKDAWAIDNDLIIGDPRSGLWSRIAKQGIPEGNPTQWDKQDCFLWPDPSLPEWPEIVNLTVPEGNYLSLYETMKGQGFRTVWLDAYTVDVLPNVGKTFFNVIFRPATGMTYEARHGLSSHDYEAEFNKWVKDKKYRLVHIESYFSHILNRISYAPIFEKSPGPAFTAYHGKSKAEHQNLFDNFTKNQGYIPVNISVVSHDGQRIYTALYEKRSVGASETRSTLSVAEYQQKFADNAAAGLQLAYLNSYLHKGEINIVAIWYQNLPAPYVEHHLDTQEFDALLKKERKANLYLRAVTGYQRGVAPNFAAIWNRQAGDL